MAANAPQLYESPDGKILAASLFQYEHNGETYQRLVYAMRAEGDSDNYVVIFQQRKGTDGPFSKPNAAEYDFSVSPPQPLRGISFIPDSTWAASKDRDEGEPARIAVAVSKPDENGRVMVGYHKIGGPDPGYWLGGERTKPATRAQVEAIFSYMAALHNDPNLDKHDGWTKTGYATPPASIEEVPVLRGTVKAITPNLKPQPA